MPQIQSMNGETLKVALLQLLPLGSLKGNLDKGLDACVRAKKIGADIALFPEMWSCGYSIPKDICELKKMAVADDGDFVHEFQTLAKELEMAIGITFLEKCEPLPKNTIALFDRRGELALKYSKVHTCDFGEEGIYVGKIDLRMLREHRATDVMGNAYRHPEKYKAITERGIEEPFVRADYRN